MNLYELFELLSDVEDFMKTVLEMEDTIVEYWIDNPEKEIQTKPNPQVMDVMFFKYKDNYYSISYMYGLKQITKEDIEDAKEAVEGYRD